MKADKDKAAPTWVLTRKGLGPAPLRSYVLQSRRAARGRLAGGKFRLHLPGSPARIVMAIVT